MYYCNKMHQKVTNKCMSENLEKLFVNQLKDNQNIVHKLEI